MLTAALILCLLNDTVVLTSEHFRLTSEVEESDALREIIADLESLWTEASGLFGQSPSGEELIDVHLYATVASYQAAELELTEGRFATNLAFSHFGTKSSHVALQPPVSEAVIARLGVPKQTRKLLVHEASHAFAYRLFPNHRSHPSWFAEGFSIWLAAKTGIARGWMSSTESDPNSSTRATTGQKLLASDRMPGLEQLMLGKLEGLSSRESYACYDLFFGFLMESLSKKKVALLLGEVRRLGGGGNFAERVKDVVVDVAGDPLKLDRKFHKFVESLKPEWDQLYRSLRVSDDGWVQSAFTDTNAIAWRREKPRKSKYTVRGSVEILPGKRTQLNFLIDRREAGPKRGFISLAFAAETGLTLFEYLPDSKGWVNLAFAKVETIVAGQQIEFEIKVSGDELRVSVDGESAIRVIVTDRDMGGPWGLGAQSGTTGIWKLEKAPGL